MHVFVFGSLHLKCYVFAGFTYKYVHAFDMESEDLLSHLEESLTFIDEGCKSGAVFVHWYVQL